MANTTTALIRPQDERIVALDKIAKESQLMAMETENPFANAITVANAMVSIRAALVPELMAPIMALQNTRLGFKCDKNYDIETVKNALIEATLRGVRPVGNEFNIIAGQCYITKEGFGRLLREIPGLQYMITPGVPKMRSDREAEAPVVIEWKYNGNAERREMTFLIRVNSGMGADAITGKATRKSRAWLYNYLTNMELGDGDADEASKPVVINVGKFDSTAPSKDGEILEAVPVVDEAMEDLSAKLMQSGTGITIDDIRAMCEEKKWPFDAARIANSNLSEFLPRVHEWKASRNA